MGYGVFFVKDKYSQLGSDHAEPALAVWFNSTENKMDFIEATILSGIAYDMLKYGTSLTANNLKQRLQGWLVNDTVANALEQQLGKLQLTDELSESAIAKKISTADELMALMAQIKPNSTTIIQTHSGTGDNIAGNKIINA